MPPVPGLRVVRSPIDGYGVFVQRDFAEGEVIAAVDGVAWHEGEDVDDRYSLKITEEVYFDMVDQTRWINHSCTPNCDIDAGLDDDGHPWANVIALRDISNGEELFYDYAFPAQLAEICRCGSPDCRGAIVDEDEVEEGLKKLGLAPR